MYIFIHCYQYQILMKIKLSLVGILCLFAVAGKSQSALFNALRKAITEQHPEIDLSEKLIAYHYWQINSAESRAQNLSFEKAAEVYRHAKLKGGSEGLLVVLINSVDAETEAQIVVKKDGIVYCIAITRENIDLQDSKSTTNGIIDARGRVIAEDIPSDRIFSTIQSLITR
jgi:hypothetical protein